MKLTLIFLLTTVVLAFCLFFSVQSCNKNKKQVKTITQISKQIIHDTIVRYTDDYGIKHAQKNVISGNKKALDVFYKSKFDSLCNQYNIQSKQLDQFIQAYLQDTGSFITQLFTNDSNTNKNFIFEDDYMLFKGIVTDSNISGNYAIDVPLDIGMFWKRKHKIWFIKFGKKIYRVDASSPNPNVYVKDLLNIKITKDL